MQCPRGCVQNENPTPDTILNSKRHFRRKNTVCSAVVSTQNCSVQVSPIQVTFTILMGEANTAPAPPYPTKCSGPCMKSSNNSLCSKYVISHFLDMPWCTLISDLGGWSVLKTKTWVWNQVLSSPRCLDAEAQAVQKITCYAAKPR